MSPLPNVANETSRLTEVVARLSALLGARSGDITPLERGLTNRSFRVTFGGSDYVVHMSGPGAEELGIDRDTECSANKSAGALGIAPPVATMLHQPHCLVTLYIEGESPTAEELSGPLLPEAARVFKRLHHSGKQWETSFDPYATVERYGGLARAYGREVEGFKESLKRARSIQKAVARHPEHQPVSCHNDPLTDNFIKSVDGLMMADWEYAGMGDPFFDLGAFSVNNGLGPDGEERLLDEYFGEPPTPRRRAALRLMRYMSDFRDGLWACVQQGISKEGLAVDLDELAQTHLTRMRELGGDPSFRDSLKAASAR
jgi:thiamine kinase-like enzyme